MKLVTLGCVHIANHQDESLTANPILHTLEKSALFPNIELQLIYVFLNLVTKKTH